MNTANTRWNYLFAAPLSPREDPTGGRAIAIIQSELRGSGSNPDISIIMLSSDDRVLYSGIKHVSYQTKGLGN